MSKRLKGIIWSHLTTEEMRKQWEAGRFKFNQLTTGSGRLMIASVDRIVRKFCRFYIFTLLSQHQSLDQICGILSSLRSILDSSLMFIISLITTLWIRSYNSVICSWNGINLDHFTILDDLFIHYSVIDQHYNCKDVWRQFARYLIIRNTLVEALQTLMTRVQLSMISASEMTADGCVSATWHCSRVTISQDLTLFLVDINMWEKQLLFCTKQTNCFSYFHLTIMIISSRDLDSEQHYDIFVVELRLGLMWTLYLIIIIWWFEEIILWTRTVKAISSINCILYHL